MNKLYRILCLGSCIPYMVLISYYFTRLYPTYFFSSLIYLVSTCLVYMGRPHGKSVPYWANIQQTIEIALIISFAFRNMYNNSFFLLLIFGAIAYGLSYLPRSLPMYATVVMCYVSSATVVGKVSGVFLIALHAYEPHAKHITIKKLEHSLTHYFHVRMLRMYMIFCMEWSLTKLSTWSLIFIVAIDLAFMLYAYVSLDKAIEGDKLYEYVNDLPPEYPIPLDIYDAIKHCNVCKSVFKSHEI